MRAGTTVCADVDTVTVYSCYVVLNSEVQLHHVAFEFLEKHLAVLNCNHYTTRSLFSKVEVSVTCSCSLLLGSDHIL